MRPLRPTINQDSAQAPRRGPEPCRGVFDDWIRADLDTDQKDRRAIGGAPRRGSFKSEKGKSKMDTTINPESTFRAAMRDRPMWTQCFPTAPQCHTDAIDEGFNACAAFFDEPNAVNLIRIEHARGPAHHAMRAAFDESFSPAGIAIGPVGHWMSVAKPLVDVIDAIIKTPNLRDGATGGVPIHEPQ